MKGMTIKKYKWFIVHYTSLPDSAIHMTLAHFAAVLQMFVWCK